MSKVSIKLTSREGTCIYIRTWQFPLRYTVRNSGCSLGLAELFTSNAMVLVGLLYFVFVFVFVSMGRSLLPNALRPFKIHCAPLNLGITRTWICLLNIDKRPIFSGLMFFNEPEISESGPRRTSAQDFYVLRKSIELSRVWTHEPWISRRALTPRPPGPTNIASYIILFTGPSLFKTNLYNLLNYHCFKKYSYRLL